MTRSRMLIALCLGPMLVAIAGCGSAQKTSAGLKQASAEYERQNYTQAHELAMSAMRSARGTEREKAAYIAGLSAFELGRIDEAERRFLSASRSSDAHIAGGAKAMLGQIRLDQDRYAEAAEFLEGAAMSLRGEDARTASRLARDARMMAVRGSERGERFRLTSEPRPSGSGVSGERPAPSRSRLGLAASTTPVSGFALQVGAFQDRRRATKAADEAAPLADRDGLGPVRIIPATDDRGRTLYFVRLGHFETRRAAAEARSRLGRLDYIVASWSRTSSSG